MKVDYHFVTSDDWGKAIYPLFRECLIYGYFEVILLEIEVSETKVASVWKLKYNT